jgi:hypothetical protein
MASSNKTKSINIRIKPLHLDFGKERTLYFPAILTNLKNTYDTKWTEEEVYGRMDPLGSFNSTSRKISLGFKIVSTTELEAQDNMAALSAFYTYLYPKYKGNVSDPSLIEKPPYFEVAFLNLLSNGIQGQGVRGYITNFNADTPVGSEDTSLFFDNNGILHFTDISVSFDMRVLHEFSTGWYDDASGFEGEPNYPYNTSQALTNSEIAAKKEVDSFIAGENTVPSDAELSAIFEALEGN